MPFHQNHRILCRESSRETERFGVTAATWASLGPVLVKLTALLGDDRYKLQDGTRRDMVSMKSELEPVLDLLGKLRGADDVACKDWVTEARELSYDMEDGFDAFTDGLERGDAGSFIQRDDGRPFKELVERVKVVSNRCGEMQKIVRNRSELTSDDPRALFLHSKDASELVGMEAKKDELVELLQKHELVCVVGFAGMGKTTLADLVYQTVKDQFQCRAFVSLHPSPDMKRILRTIHSQAADGATVVSASAARDATEKNLIDDISAFLDDKRYLVIIDDVWNWEEWEIIVKALPKNNLGCKIIMTTRIKTIAEKCQTEHGAQLHRYSFGYQDASRLSEMILKKSGDGGVLEANAKRLSSKIVDMCDGIPLAVICLSSAWADSQHLQGDDGEWDTWASHMVMERFLSTPSLTPLVQSLSLGFDHLPVDARTCLLYCSIYPPGYLIQRDCLVRMWIAEGFVWNEEVAEAYFDKFVCMNLLQPVGESTYRVHPLVLACLVCKATEDNFVDCRRNNIDPGSSSSRAKQVRRLSLYADHCPDEDFSRTRSLLVGPEPQLDGVPFTKFNQLRVLEIGNRGLENAHLMDICGLIWLRYLGLKWASVEALPEDIGNLRNLETLDVRGTRISELPTATVLEKLQHLRTLNISDTKITELPKDIEKLQLLTTLDISGTNVTELPREIGKLRRLKTLNASGTKVRELPKEVEDLEHLETLDISCTEVAYLPKEIGNLQLLEILNASRTSVAALPREIGRLQYLKTLNVSGTKVSDVPKEIGTLQYLRTLDISYTKVKDVPGEITKLERLENLDVRNTCVMELPKEIKNLQRLRTLDVRGTKVRDLLVGVNTRKIRIITLTQEELSTRSSTQ